MLLLFCRNNKVFTEAVTILTEFPDLDKLLSGLTYVPKTLTQNTVRAGIDTLIGIKHALKLSRSLADLLGTVTHPEFPAIALQQHQQHHHLHHPPTANNGIANESNNGPDDTAQHMMRIEEELMQQSFRLFKEIMKNFTDPALSHLEEAIAELFSESTTFSKSSYEMRYQECFAVKSGINGLLDIARQTYLSTAEDIHRVCFQFLSLVYCLAFLALLTFFFFFCFLLLLLLLLLFFCVVLMIS